MPGEKTQIAKISAYGCRSSRATISIAIPCWILLVSALPVATRGQGFGLTKKTVKLERKMPAVVHLPGPGFDVHAVARERGNEDAAQTLSELLTVEMQKYDKRLE